MGTGVLNNRSRNAALMAVTFKTLDEFAPGRVILGIGAWWEPLASKVGRTPDAARRFHEGVRRVLRAFFRNELVDFHGEFVHMDGVRFDSMYRANKPVAVPIYFGAVGPRMLELAGEIADGVYLDFLLPVEYLKSALGGHRTGHRQAYRRARRLSTSLRSSPAASTTRPRSKHWPPARSSSPFISVSSPISRNTQV